MPTAWVLGMPVVGCPPGEGASVRIFAVGIEHPCRLAVPSHPLPTQVAEMGTHGSHARAVADDPGLDGDPAPPLAEKAAVRPPSCHAAPLESSPARIGRAITNGP